MELDKIELFSSLSPGEISQIASIAKRVHLARGETVFTEGDFQKNIFIVETGQVEIYKRTPLSGEQVLATMNLVKWPFLKRNQPDLLLQGLFRLLR